MTHMDTARRGLGEGSIHRQWRNGKLYWRGTVELPRGPDGKRRQRSIVRKDRDEVVHALGELAKQPDGPRPRRAATLKRTPESIRNAVKASLQDAIDPSGYVVYLLWGDDLEQPLYIGRSTNVLTRLGTHLGDGSKRGAVRKVSMIRCDSERTMCKMEERMIRLYRPEWNIACCPPEHRALVRSRRQGGPSVDEMRDAMERRYSEPPLNASPDD